MKNTILLFINLLTVAIVACVRNAKVEPPKVERQITLSCFISPDEDTVSAVVAWSRPLFVKSNNPYEVTPVKNATVIISGDKGNLVLTNFYSDQLAPKYWTIQPPGFFEPGKTYTINIAEPGGKTLSATTTIPPRKELNIRPAIIDSSTVSVDDGNNKFFKIRFSVTFTDDPTPGDYYRVSGGYFLVFKRLVPDGEVFKLVKDSSYYKIFFNRSELHSDETGGGGDVTFNTESQIIHHAIDEPWDSSKPDIYYFPVLQTDQHYYRYHKYVENYQGNDPFSEPKPFPSNVSGGQGIFGSYVKHVALLSLK